MFTDSIEVFKKPIYQNNLRVMPFVVEASQTPCIPANDDLEARPFTYPIHTEKPPPKPLHLDLVIAWLEAQHRDIKIEIDRIVNGGDDGK